MMTTWNEAAYRYFTSNTGEGAGAGVVLLSDADETGDPTGAMQGGTYLWQYQGTFGGAVLTLQSLGPDGSTYQTVTSATAAGQSTILVGQGDILRVTVTGGTPSALYSAVRRVS
jgi:hypothetical protein